MTLLRVFRAVRLLKRYESLRPSFSWLASGLIPADCPLAASKRSWSTKWLGEKNPWHQAFIALRHQCSHASLKTGISTWL